MKIHWKRYHTWTLSGKYIWIGMSEYSYIDSNFIFSSYGYCGLKDFPVGPYSIWTDMEIKRNVVHDDQKISFPIRSSETLKNLYGVGLCLITPPSKTHAYKDETLYPRERLEKFSDDDLYLLHLHNLFLPYLPYDSETIKNIRTLCKTCSDLLINSKKHPTKFTSCKHSIKQKSFLLVLPLQEIEFACTNKGKS